MEGTHSSQQPERPAKTRSAQPRLVTQFEVHDRGVALRIRVERLPSPADVSDDDSLAEAGYGHGV